MPNQRKMTPDPFAHMRVYLEKKSKAELINLLLDLAREMDEPTRQKFWGRLAPPGMATADLRYPSAGDFLAELQSFAEKVSEQEYYDEDAATYYGEDNYNEYEQYQPERHPAIKALKTFFREADSYFDSGQFEVARQAYRILLDIALGDAYETLGIPDPLTFVPQEARQVVNRYLVAMQRSLTQEAFFRDSLHFLWAYEQSEDVERFLEMVGSEHLPALQKHIEAWADQHEQVNLRGSFYGLAFPLRLLLRFYEQAGRTEAIREVWVRFRRQYPACYTPLLADRQAAKDWEAVIRYAQEAVELDAPSRLSYYVRDAWASPDKLSLRGYLARAFSATGDTLKAFELYRPAMEETPDFDTYAQARQLADAVSTDKGQEFTRQAIERLLGQGPHRRYLLCQVYLSENRFDEAYAQVEKLAGYQGMEESKLVAKAHLLAAFGQAPDERMGSNLRDLYAKIEQGEKEPLRFLHLAVPQAPNVQRATAIQRAQTIYTRLMQAHIDNGRKTYATAAYYCALLGEIFIHEGRATAFRDWYEELMDGYRRFRALRSEMDLKVGPVLRTSTR